MLFNLPVGGVDMSGWVGRGRVWVSAYQWMGGGGRVGRWAGELAFGLEGIG